MGTAVFTKTLTKFKTINMKQIYDYQKVEQVHRKLNNKGYKMLEKYRINTRKVNSIEMWIGEGEMILLELYIDGNCGIYKDTNDI
jgi:hypothetical protein